MRQCAVCCRLGTMCVFDTANEHAPWQEPKRVRAKLRTAYFLRRAATVWTPLSWHNVKLAHCRNCYSGSQQCRWYLWHFQMMHLFVSRAHTDQDSGLLCRRARLPAYTDLGYDSSTMPPTAIEKVLYPEYLNRPFRNVRDEAYLLCQMPTQRGGEPASLAAANSGTGPQGAGSLPSAASGKVAPSKPRGKFGARFLGRKASLITTGAAADTGGGVMPLYLPVSSCRCC